MFRAVACVISAGVLIQPAFLSQEFRSTIGGAVTDQQGAVLPSIEILAIQMEYGSQVPNGFGRRWRVYFAICAT